MENEEIKQIEVKEEKEEPVETRTTEEEVVEEKMLPQSQVNEIVARARKEGRESAMKEILAKYSVQSEEELSAVYDKGTKYDVQSESYKEVKAENALLKSDFAVDKYESVKAILVGKGLEVTPENIEKIFPEYPEWHKKAEAQPTILRKLGNEVKPKAEEEESEYEAAMKLYGIRRK